MATPSAPRLRRTWPQRLLILFNLGVIGACLAAAFLVREAEREVGEVPRVSFDKDVLIESVEPGEPLTFLLVGADSSAGLDPDDPRQVGRDVDQESAGQVRADSIVLLRVDPETGQAATMSIPRDLWVEVPGSGQEWKINSALAIGGREKLVETVSENFGLEINHFVQVDFAGFADVIDVMGGVHVWFENPARDAGSGLDVPEAGCVQLDGDQALAYVRGRTYEEFIDDRWRVTGGNDLARIDRQQDFLIVALDQALAAGGRNPVEIRRLVEAGVQSVILDDRLSPNDLIDLANAMGDFEPDRLQRYSLEVYDDRVDGLAVLRVQPDQAEAVFDVFRGEAGFVSPADVTVVMGGADPEHLADARTALTDKGFIVDASLDVGDIDPDIDPDSTTLLFSADQADQAELLARFLDPVPELVLVAGEGESEGEGESDGEGEGEAVLRLSIGADYDSVRLIARPESDVEPDVQAVIEGGVATETTVGDDQTVESTTTESSGPASGESDDEAVPDTTVPPTTTVSIIGRAPDGESCP